MLDVSDEADNTLKTVIEVLERTREIDVLSALSNAIQFSVSTVGLEKTVIAFDANVILRLSTHRKSEDIIDYLRTSFAGKLILPGQVVQEFWNNQLQSVVTKSDEIKQKFNELSVLIEGVDDRFAAFSGRFTKLLDEFKSDFGYVYDDRTTARTNLLIELLQEKATVPFVPRSLLSSTVLWRKRTKTPPGFKDELDGDFYVWADLLLGLVRLKNEGFDIQKVILVTLDKKIDWSRSGVPHPILSSEIIAVCGATFETITVDTLAKKLLE